MKTPRIQAILLLSLLAATTGNAQFKAVGPAPYTPAVARQRIRALLLKTDPANRQQSIAAISGLLIWFRDVSDDELIAAWKKDDGRENLPDVVTALADARVAAEVVEFSWRQRRPATFRLADVPMFEDLMLRFPDSAKPFLDDLLASPDSLALSEQESYAVCRILLDMPDIRTWRQNALQILPHFRDAAENLLAAGRSEGSEDKRRRTQYWTSALRPPPPPSPASGLNQRTAVLQIEDALKSGTLECTGGPIRPNAEYVFPNVPTANRRFEYDRKIWDVRLEPGLGDTKNFILKNKSSSPQKRCTVRWTVVP